MEPLIEEMKVLLADVFALYLKTHNFHWNIEGADFPQYHDFLGDLYQEVHDSVDKIAEQIRALDEYAPGSLSRFRELSDVKDSLSPPPPSGMFSELHGDNELVMNTIMRTYKLADQYNAIGLSNFLQDRYDAHKKHAWMLRSILKKRQ